MRLVLIEVGSQTGPHIVSISSIGADGKDLRF
jgi:hypothetical protein